MDETTPDILVRSLNLLKYIVEQHGVQLDQKNFGKCPFHDEDTASFNIFQAQSGRARYHCFGCEAGGDIFNFLKLTEQLSFRAATVRLSGIANKHPTFSSSELSEGQTDNKLEARQCSGNCSVEIDALRRQVSTLNSKVDRLAYLARCVKIGFPEKIHEAFDQLEPEDFR